ncbi:aspartate 1-decarboxylase [Virgibacillus sp. MSJ-26]|uniref:aspartate 1-decarboxylase n=1 Tax=Virgibacillus sp. MSJ-26 TaxID=2841522 RepID=UPI001C124865|nr:aspartate 1-decarboxylase [Virgibacillus sp. MSJ-26]
MYRTLMKSKIHRATVTHADLNYVGSVTIDQDILDSVDIIPNEKVQIVNNNNGARLETYVIAGERGTGIICLNGAAARLVQKGDTVIIISYAMIPEANVNSFNPKIAIMNDKNEIEQMIDQEMPLTKV